MIQLLGRFAALSLIGTLLLSLLPSGGLKRTAAFSLGLLMLLSWAEGIATLLDLPLEVPTPDSMLSATSTNVEQAAANAADALLGQWEADR